MPARVPRVTKTDAVVLKRRRFGDSDRIVTLLTPARGKLEAVTLDALDQVALSLSRLAQDLILFSLPELGYVTLPVELCTGSSIMPHKRNPDGLELVRARAATVSGLAGAVKGIVRNLPSGYHRDLQETKRPYLQALETVAGQLKVMRLTVDRLQVREEALARALTPELFATDGAFALVQGGMAFRDAYRAAAGAGVAGSAPERGDLHTEAAASARRTGAGAVGEGPERDDLRADAEQAMALRTSTGTAGNLDLPGCRRRSAVERRRVDGAAARVGAALVRLAGRPVQVCRSAWLAPREGPGA